MLPLGKHLHKIYSYSNLVFKFEFGLSGRDIFGSWLVWTQFCAVKIVHLYVGKQVTVVLSVSLNDFLFDSFYYFQRDKSRGELLKFLNATM